MPPSEEKFCKECGKPVGTGTLLDQFTIPPYPHTGMHRLYLLIKLDFEEFPTPEQQAQAIDEKTWKEFAEVRRCIACADILNNINPDDPT